MAMGGVGEAALLGAAMGGGASALTGGDPLKGALLGGLTGGVGGGISGLGAAGTGAGAAAGAGAGAGTTAITPAMSELMSGAGVAPAVTPGAAGAGLTGGLPQGMSFAEASQLANQTAAEQAARQATEQALPLTTQATQGATSAAAGPSLFDNPLAYVKAHPFIAGASGIAGATGARRAIDLPPTYTGPLSRYRFNPDYYVPQRLAAGGIASLGGAAQGRYLRGPGDGMSDSIPATIDGHRKAQLATNEFVVPADVVSNLGNGSSDAGAKKLYEMMDRVRTARTGRKVQPKAINPNKYLPG